MNANENIFFKRFDGTVRKIFFEDKDKYIVLSWIIFRTNYQEEYQGLKRNECYFSYSVVEKECSVSRGKLQKILLELEKENFIVWVHKSKVRHTQSIIYLIENEQYGKQYGTQYGKSYSKNVENTSVKVNYNTVNSMVANTVNNTSSRNISKNISRNNNIYSLIFENWISKNIKKHRSLTNDIKKAIDKTLKEFTKDEILEAINNYSVMYNDKSYKWCDYQWGLQEFLLRKDKDGIRQLGMFLNDGSKQANYESWKKEREHNANTNRFAKRDRGVFNEDSENIRIELPKQEHRHYTNEELEALGID
ncbi:hypothetical protein [Clostridium diolis]|uniref:hypothetical protein n=1 Tax=Clostridium diolis TaxID=223919 RepID=UPI003AF7F03A